MPCVRVGERRSLGSQIKMCRKIIKRLNKSLKWKKISGVKR